MMQVVSHAVMEHPVLGCAETVTIGGVQLVVVGGVVAHVVFNVADTYCVLWQPKDGQALLPPHVYVVVTVGTGVEQPHGFRSVEVSTHDE